MRIPLYLFLLVTISTGCASPSKEVLILGNWEVVAWVDSRDNINHFTEADAPKFSVRFEKDTVYATISDKDSVIHYEAEWNIINDTLELKDIEKLGIDTLSTKKCILTIKTPSYYPDRNKLHTETITLLRK